MSSIDELGALVPSLHTIRAALRTAALIDSKGSSRRAASSAYLRDPSGAVFNGDDLRRGEDLLLACGLVVDRDSVLFPSPLLSELLNADESEAHLIILSAVLSQTGAPVSSDLAGGLMPRVGPLAAIADIILDPESREAFLIAVAGSKSNLHKALGDIGEELIVSIARDELQSLGHPDLAAKVRRVSTLADTLGYDVTAPFIAGGNRRLEVKTTHTSVEFVCTFFISRNEYMVGLRDGSWALVICEWRENEARVVGWCRASVLAPYVPADSPGGSWTEARVALPAHVLKSAIPPAI